MLTKYQKSVYLMLLNATMVTRSIGKNTGRHVDLTLFKISLFKKLDELISKMNDGTFKNKLLRKKIKELTEEFNISVGQSQKAINVILKYHYYFFVSSIDQNNLIKSQLDCPLDKIILQDIGVNIKLNVLDMTRYLKSQNIIQFTFPIRVEKDDIWDDQLLERHGLL